MPNGWPFSWEGMATKEGESPKTRCVGSLLVVYLCVSVLARAVKDRECGEY
jgi:hypothetical protein